MYVSARACSCMSGVVCVLCCTIRRNSVLIQTLAVLRAWNLMFAQVPNTCWDAGFSLIFFGPRNKRPDNVFRILEKENQVSFLHLGAEISVLRGVTLGPRRRAQGRAQTRTQTRLFFLSFLWENHNARVCRCVFLFQVTEHQHMLDIQRTFDRGPPVLSFLFPFLSVSLPVSCVLYFHVDVCVYVNPVFQHISFVF